MYGAESNHLGIDEFSGTKIALINNGCVLAILRDNKPDIDFPGMWDLPGGARDNEETPVQTAIREVQEELGIDIKPEEIVWEKAYPAVAHPGMLAVFMVINLTDEQVDSVVFGDEGREWKMMPFEEFLNHDNAVPGMQTRLGDYLKSPKEPLGYNKANE